MMSSDPKSTDVVGFKVYLRSGSEVREARFLKVGNRVILGNKEIDRVTVRGKYRLHERYYASFEAFEREQWKAWSDVGSIEF